MTAVALFDAKNRLSELIERVQAGEEFVITHRGKAVARLALPEADGAQARAQDAIARLRSRDLIARGRR